jgi:excisionase family DNA binding protein
MATKLLHTIPEAMDSLAVRRTTVYALAAKGELEIVKIGSRALVTDESMRALVDRLKAQGTRRDG